MDNPFADLIPQQPQQASQAQTNPFADLIPESTAVPRGTAQPQEKISPFMSAITGFNTGVGRLAHGILQPLTESGLLGDRVAQGSKNEAARREADYQVAKESNPMTAGVSEFVGNVAPTLFIPGMGAGGLAARLGKGALAGAGIGASQYVNPDQSRAINALFGAAGGALGAGAGEGLQAAMRYGNKLYAQSAMPGLVERATDKIKGYITPEQAAKTLQGNFNKASGANTANWNQVTNLANTLDSELAAQGKAFNTAPFVDKVQDFLIKTEKMEPAVRAKYEQAINFANHIKEQTPLSFNGAVALRQNLNQELKKFLEKNNIKSTDKETSALITQLKTSLQDTVKANSGNVDKNILNDFTNSWEKANKSHTGLQEYFKRPNAETVLKPTKQRREALQANQLDRAALGSYLRPSQGGLVGVNQLNKLTGGDDAARSYIMRNVIEGRGQPNNALTAYEKLSAPQREALFARLPEGEMLKAASVARNTLGEAPKEGFRAGLHHVGALGLPGLAGFLGAKTIGGQDWDTSLAAGLGTAALSRGGQAAISRYASPASVMRAIQRAKTPSKNAGRFLSPELASLFSDRTPEKR